MEAISLGFLLGVGVTLAVRRGGPRVRQVIQWTARQSGWIAARTAAAVEETRRRVREQYARGRAASTDDAGENGPPGS